MSSDVLARVNVFAAKAEGLFDKGHLLRAAENYGRAAEAAKPLGADNIVAQRMHLRQGNMLLYYTVNALESAAIDPRIRAAHRTDSVNLFSGAVEALERRRVAGTLLEGKCAAAEVAWSASELQRGDAYIKTAEGSARLTPAEVASFSTLAGYDEFLYSAVNVLDVLLHAGTFATECSAVQLQYFAQHVVTAAELMQQPRRNGNHVGMSVEVIFASVIHVTVTKARGLDAHLVQLLAGAWERLQRSGVLQARRIVECMHESMPDTRAYGDLVRSSMKAPGLRCCALPCCGAKEAHPAHFKSCAACRTVAYCCREHQAEGWPGHKKACKAARKAAAAAEDAAADEEDGAGPSGA